MFARSFQITVAPLNVLVLFLTAWLIYLADRLADSHALSDAVVRSLRQEFCVRHQRSWIGPLIILGLVDAFLICHEIESKIVLAGIIVGTFAIIHLLQNYALGGAWPPFPLKEITIGSLFTAGTMVALSPVPPVTDAALVLSGVAFAGLCTSNCISIAYWERELDEAQGKVTFATRFPRLGQYLPGVLILLAFACGVAAVVYPHATPVFGCVSASSLFLALVNFWQKKIGRDERTALADLVLLTPLLTVPLMNS
jgi:hypothetical protein